MRLSSIADMVKVIFVVVAVVLLAVGFLAVSTDAAGGTTREKRLYLVSDVTERLEGDELLLDGNFWIWTNYDVTRVNYTWGSNGSYTASTRGTRIPGDVHEFITFHDGGHLTITAEGETIWEGYTYRESTLNKIRYNWGITQWPTFIFALIGVLVGGGYRITQYALIERRAR